MVPRAPHTGTISVFPGVFEKYDGPRMQSADSRSVGVATTPVHKMEKLSHFLFFLLMIIPL